MANLGTYYPSDSGIGDARFISQSHTPFQLRTLQQNDLSEVAALLSRCFYPQEGWRSWLNPIMQMGIFHDLQSRHSVRLTPYTSLIGIHSYNNSSPELVGTVEVALKSLSPFLPFAPAVPYISNLAVTPHCRCQGVGKQLLLACEKIVYQWGHQHLYLHVLDDNAPARRLYAEIGYQLSETPSHWSSLAFVQPKKLLLRKCL